MKSLFFKVMLIAFNKGLLNWLPDKPYIKIKYRACTGEKLNLAAPETFNEKIQWLKLYDRKDLYTNLVDKYEVKKIVQGIIGDKYIIPTIGVWDNVEDIPFDTLPMQFVLKCTHDSGSVVICKNKNEININETTEYFRNAIKKNYYKLSREWPYKNVKPRIIAEKYIVDESKTELKDYKIFCFDGEPKLIQVDFNRFVNHERNLYDTNWNYINAEIEYPTNPNVEIAKPKHLLEMLEIAKKVSADLKHARIDLYDTDDGVFFGEITFYHGAGIEKFNPRELNYRMGEWIKLT